MGLAIDICPGDQVLVYWTGGHGGAWLAPVQKFDHVDDEANICLVLSVIRDSDASSMHITANVLIDGCELEEFWCHAKDNILMSPR